MAVVIYHRETYEIQKISGTAPIILGIGKLLAFTTPDISRLKEGAVLKKSPAPPTFYSFWRRIFIPKNILTV